MTQTLGFSKQQRLLAAADFNAVFNQPIKKIHSEHLLLFVGQGQHCPRLGLAITKKKLKRAHDRNQLKRHTKECFRLMQHQLPVCDCVLIVKKNYLPHLAKKQTSDTTPVFGDIRQEIQQLFDKLAKSTLHAPR